MGKTRKEKWSVLERLPERELKAFKPLSRDVIQKALEKGRVERRAVEKHARRAHTDSRILFR
ncbi:MAG: hypothetical protein KAY24_14360 [Candidatus Eisenbacteria sp.]|nr:hypothetical protein [Candidatus Eisenbacteria bacterium]